jgi:hypothetical protein
MVYSVMSLAPSHTVRAKQVPTRSKQSRKFSLLQPTWQVMRGIKAPGASHRPSSHSQGILVLFLANFILMLGSLYALPRTLGFISYNASGHFALSLEARQAPKVLVGPVPRKRH